MIIASNVAISTIWLQISFKAIVSAACVEWRCLTSPCSFGKFLLHRCNFGSAATLKIAGTSLHVSSLCPYPVSSGHPFPFLVRVVKVLHFLSVCTLFSTFLLQGASGSTDPVSFLPTQSAAKQANYFSSLLPYFCFIALFLGFLLLFPSLHLLTFLPIFNRLLFPSADSAASKRRTHCWGDGSSPAHCCIIHSLSDPVLCSPRFAVTTLTGVAVCCLFSVQHQAGHISLPFSAGWQQDSLWRRTWVAGQEHTWPSGVLISGVSLC